MTTIQKLFRLAPIAWVSVAFGATLVVPNSNLNSPGNTSDPFPTTSTSLEFQELLGSGQFNTSPITITAISLRAAPGTGPVNVTYSSLTVTLSNSPNYPNTSNSSKTLMSSTFADNVGTNKMQVFSGSNIVLKDSGCAAGAIPCPFDLTITLQTPFVYNFSLGPLLIDIVETLSATSGAVDAASFTAPGGSVATVVGTAGSATGTFAYAGPIVQVTYTTTAPQLGAVVNVASNIPPGMPNYGIAQGSLFAVYGIAMGPTNLVVSSLPLPTTAGLSGTSITISGTGATVTAPIYFTRSDIVVAVMPSNTPPGSGTMTLTYNGQIGEIPITVVQSNFGISNNLIPNANNGIGLLNTAAVTFANNQAVTTTYTAKPGDILAVWGTGLGATPGSGGDTGAPPAGDIGTAPQVFIGGVASPSVSYWGRSPGLFPGLDQINFEVPPNAPLGCNVSIVVETSNGGTPVVSNAPTIALAATDGATCSDPTEYIPPSDLSLSSAKIIYLGAQENVSVSPNPNGSTTTTTSSEAQALLFQQTQAQVAALAPQIDVEPSFGSCYVGTAAVSSGGGGGGPAGTYLNAGPAITLTPPSGAVLNLAAQGTGIYQSAMSSNALAGGTWTFSDGSGGPDVGPLNFQFPLPQPVTWTNQSALTSSTITRTNPVTITWAGGDSNGYVDIEGWAAGTSLYTAQFQCAAPVSAGQFTIPPSILLALPAAPGNLQVSTYALPNTLGSVPGFTVSVAGSQFQTSIPVNFK